MIHESPALYAAETFDSGGLAHVPAQLPLPEHIRKLRRALSAIEASDDLGVPPLRCVIEPLRVAAALYDVRADTAIDDGTISYCGPAMAFEDANSVVASRYLAATIIFNFAWLALEQAILTVAPPAKGSSGARGRKAFAHMGRSNPGLESALQIAWGIAVDAGDMAADLAALTSILGSATGPEIAFEFVRRLRNLFAHGKITPPLPLDWTDGTPPPPNPEVDRFFAATRLVLFLLVHLLAPLVARLEVEPPYQDFVPDEEDEHSEFVPADWLLLTAHSREPPDLFEHTLFSYSATR